MYDDITLEELAVDPNFKQVVYMLCMLHNDPELLTTSDQFRISCVEALRFGYMVSKYLGVNRQEFMEGLHAVMELEDSNEERLH